MKQFITIALISLLSFPVLHAQDFAFGAKAGGNIASLGFSSDSYSVKSVFGVHFGAFGTYSISEKFSLQAEVSYATGGNKWTYNPTSAKGEIKANYLNIPILAKYKVIDKLSLEAGPQYSALLSMEQSIAGSSFADIKEFYKSGNIALAFGAEYDLADLLENLSVAVRYFFDLSNLNDAPVGGGGVKTSMIQFGVAYKLTK